MPSFIAADVVEPLDYDFRPHYDLHGTIKEPSDKQIEAFQKAFRDEMKRVQELAAPDAGPDGITPDQFFTALERAGDEDLAGTLRRQAAIFAKLCSGKPSEADLVKVPFRVRNLFYAWLVREVMNPEAAAGGGNAQLLSLPSAASA